MKKNISIQVRDYNVQIITNGAESFDKIVVCFHGFNGDKWGDAYSGLKKRLNNSLVVSFDACGHGESEILSVDMRLDIILEEIEGVVRFLNSEAPDKPIIFVACSYGAYRVMTYLIKYRPSIKKVIYVNPAFRMLTILEKIKGFRYSELTDTDKIIMKESLNKYIKKPFLDDLFNNDLYSDAYDVNYSTQIVVGKRDSLVPFKDTLEIAKKYNYDIIYVDDEHCFENKENWQKIVDMIEGVV